MRTTLLAAALLLFVAAPAHANTISFGSVSFSATNHQVNGNTADRNASQSWSVNNGALDAAAGATLRAQTSADEGLASNPTAIFDRTFTFDIPYTVTRTITGGPGPFIAGLANVPIQTISFNINSVLELAYDNTQVGGGFARSVSFNGTASSLGGLFGSQTLNIAGGQGGENNSSNTQVINTVDVPSFGTSANFSGPNVGEVTFLAEIPTDYRMWEDFLAPGQAIDYNNPWSVTQSISDTLRITFRLRSESRAAGSISTTGGETIACLGQNSSLSAFDLDDGSRCDNSGVFINASVSQTGTAQIEVPEPATLGLVGLGALALVAAARRRRS